MALAPIKRTNYDHRTEIPVYNAVWDDDFDDDNEDDEVFEEQSGTIHQIENKPIEKHNLAEVTEQIEFRKGLQTDQNLAVTNENITDTRSSIRRLSSIMKQRSTVYDTKPDDFAYDPTLGSPIEARVITDICCFIWFIAFLAIWIFITVLVFNVGNLERFAVPKPKSGTVNHPVTSGSVCGQIGKENDPHELDFNLFKCVYPLVAFQTCETKSVCVRECPKVSFSFAHYKGKRDYDPQAKPPNELLGAIKCIGSSQILPTMGHVEAVIANGQCAEITTKSFNLKGTKFKTWHFKCIPDVLDTEIDFIIDYLDDVMPQMSIPWRITYEFIGRIRTDCVGNSMAYCKAMYSFSDMLEGWYILIGFLIVALILTLMMVYCMKFLAKFLFVISNVLNGALWTASIYTCYKRGVVFEEYSLNLFRNDVWGLTLVFTSFVAIVVLVQFFIERRCTLITLELIKETTIVIEFIKSLLVFPLIFYGIQAAGVILSMYIGFTIKSISETDYKLTYTGSKNESCNCNNYVDGGFCNPGVIGECMYEFSTKGLKTCKLECSAMPENQKPHQTLVKFSQLTNLFGYFWAVEYLYLFELTVLALTFAIYYWTFHKRDMPPHPLYNGLCMGLRYHLGTIFFAWLFLCIYSYIRFQFQFIDTVISFLPFSLVHFFFKYVVIAMALCGDDFYKSAKEVVLIVKQNVRLIIVSKFMSEILFFYLKLLITAVIGAITYIVVLLFSWINPAYFKNDLFPVYIVCMGTYLIATEIFNIYILGVDTFTFCYIEDVSINNGDLATPYFMPRPLMRICNLKNKLATSSYDNRLDLKSVKTS